MTTFKWVVVFLLIIPCTALAVPQLINYQGKLSDTSSNPANGDVSITFAIYNAPSAGDVLWTETQTVTVMGGIFNVLLGSQTPILANTFDGNERYLGVKVGTDAEMTPRQQLASVPYAMKAAAVDGLDMSRPTTPTITIVNATWAGARWKPAMVIYGTEATDDEGIFTYTVFRDGHFVSNGDSPVLADTNLEELTTYCYQIAAINWAFNRSEKSNIVCQQSAGFIDNGNGTISQLGLSGMDFGIDLMWQQVDDGNTYNWYEANGIYNAT